MTKSSVGRPILQPNFDKLSILTYKDVASQVGRCSISPIQLLDMFAYHTLLFTLVVALSSVSVLSASIAEGGDLNARDTSSPVQDGGIIQPNQACPPNTKACLSQSGLFR